jgi:hypothetical protein
VATALAGVTLGVSWGSAQPGSDQPFTYATFIGGGAEDGVLAVAAAADGGILVAGYTASADLGNGAPGLKVRGNGQDAFVAKLASDGSRLEWVSILGGNASEHFSAMDVAANGDVILAGGTFSSEFPVTEGAWDADYSGYPPTSGMYSGADAIVVRISANGTSLVFSTYLGGLGNEYASSVDERGDGSVVVAGDTTSTDFPTTAGSFDREPNKNLTRYGSGDSYMPFDGFVTTLSANGSQLVFSTYVGGYYDDHIVDMAVGPGLNVTLAGYTQSDHDFPFTPSATGLMPFDGEYIGVWTFVVRLNENGSGLLFSGALPSARGLWGFAMALDEEGGTFVAGMGYGLNVTEGAFNATTMEYANQSFVAHINSDATRMTEATWLGPEGYVTAIALTGGGGVAVGLSTYSRGFPVTAANAAAGDFQYEGYVGVLSCDLSDLVAGSYIGGSKDDFVQAATAGAHGSLIVAGGTNSPDFPVSADGLDKEMGTAPSPGNADTEGFVGVLEVGNASGLRASASTSPARGTVATEFSFNASGSRIMCGPSVSLEYRWDFDGDATADTGWSDQATATHTFATPGTYNATAEVRTPAGEIRSAVVVVKVTSSAGDTPPQVTYSAPARTSAPDWTFAATVTVADPEGVAAVYLVYRVVGASVFENASLHRAGGTQWTGTAPLASGSDAVEYYFVAVDGVGDVTRSPETGLYTTQVVGPPEPIEGDLALPLLIALPAAAFLLFAALRWRRRGHRGPQ